MFADFPSEYGLKKLFSPYSFTPSDNGYEISLQII